MIQLIITLFAALALAAPSPTPSRQPVETLGIVHYNAKTHKVIRVVKPENGKIQAKAVDECFTNPDIKCEPVYRVRAFFSRHKKSPQPSVASPSPSVLPLPVPIATPSLTPSGLYDYNGDLLDYSKTLMHAVEAWGIAGAPKKQIIVAIVDSGVDTQHPDLKYNLLPGFNFITNQEGAEDDYGHGSHCAGIVGASRNGKGTIGIAPNVKLLPIKFLGADGSGDTVSGSSAIDYAVSHGANIISLSWGSAGNSTVLGDSIAAAIAKGIIVVAAAGNDGQDMSNDPLYPALYPGVISVASTTSGDVLSSFSNYGSSFVTVAASGSQIYSTYLNNGYTTLSGTSMATPAVAGALAEAWSIHPELSAAQLTQKLCDTSEKILLEKVRCGRMNVLKLVQ